jgi:hypothetical protein
MSPTQNGEKEMNQDDIKNAMRLVDRQTQTRIALQQLVIAVNESNNVVSDLQHDDTANLLYKNIANNKMELWRQTYSEFVPSLDMHNSGHSERFAAHAHMIAQIVAPFSPSGEEKDNTSVSQTLYNYVSNNSANILNSLAKWTSDVGYQPK